MADGPDNLEETPDDGHAMRRWKRPGRAAILLEVKGSDQRYTIQQLADKHSWHTWGFHVALSTARRNKAEWAIYRGLEFRRVGIDGAVKAKAAPWLPRATLGLAAGDVDGLMEGLRRGQRGVAAQCQMDLVIQWAKRVRDDQARLERVLAGTASVSIEQGKVIII
jgi:hypothetical protein